MLSDVERAVGPAYGANREPDPSVGFPKRVTAVIAPDGTIARHYDEVTDAGGHPDVLLEDLRGLVAEAGA